MTSLVSMRNCGSRTKHLCSCHLQPVWRKADEASARLPLAAPCPKSAAGRRTGVVPSSLAAAVRLKNARVQGIGRGAGHPAACAEAIASRAAADRPSPPKCFCCLPCRARCRCRCAISSASRCRCSALDATSAAACGNWAPGLM